MKSSTVTADVKAGKSGTAGAKQTQLASSPSPDEIRQRADELHLDRGCVHGLDQDDWLQAERDPMEKHQAR